MFNTRLVEGLLGTAMILLSNAPARAQSTAYDQPYRPLVHFSPEKNWTNDPNGLVYFEG
jgi:sucrose-6-phosphate hydrolase SacC (GH32 family)